MLRTIWKIVAFFVGSFLVPFVPLVLDLLSLPAKAIISLVVLVTRQPLERSVYNLLVLGLSMSIWFTVAMVYLYFTQ